MAKKGRRQQYVSNVQVEELFSLEEAREIASEFGFPDAETLKQELDFTYSGHLLLDCQEQQTQPTIKEQRDLIRKMGKAAKNYREVLQELKEVGIFEFSRLHRRGWGDEDMECGIENSEKLSDLCEEELESLRGQRSQHEKSPEYLFVYWLAFMYKKYTGKKPNIGQYRDEDPNQPFFEFCKKVFKKIGDTRSDEALHKFVQRVLQAHKL